MADQQNGRSAFREHLPDLSAPRFTAMCSETAHGYAERFKTQRKPPWIHALYQHWLLLHEESFKGITTDGHVRDNLFHIEDEGLDIDQIVTAAESALSLMSDEQRTKTLFHIDAPEWRTWSNPEFLLSNKGVRLDEITAELRSSILKLLQVSLSPEGYQKAVSAMRINGFLGQLVKSPMVMNEFSYNFALFGRPSRQAPWGFSFYGHHLCLNLFFYKRQIVVSPWFTGAEPNVIDEGPYRGTQILHREEALGLELMNSLSEEKQSKAQIYKLMKDPSMPYGRWNHDDQRHLCGAYRDNRVVPYEGITVSSLNKEQQGLVSAILYEYLLYLPSKSRAIRLAQCEKVFEETYFCWIGGFGTGDAFYYRIQSPLVIVEFDHHSGVFLNNKEAAKFHIHTLLRTPNAGDYGHALRKVIPGRSQDFQWDG